MAWRRAARSSAARAATPDWGGFVEARPATSRHGTSSGSRSVIPAPDHASPRQPLAHTSAARTSVSSRHRVRACRSTRSGNRTGPGVRRTGFCRHAMCGSHDSSAHPQVWQSSIQRGASRSYPRGRGDDGRGLAADTLVLELPPRARGRLRLRLLASPVPTRTRRTPLQVTDHRRDRPTVGARGRHPLQQCARAGIRDDAPRLARPTPPALTTRNSGRSASRSRQEPRACRRNRARPRGRRARPPAGRRPVVLAAANMLRRRGDRQQRAPLADGEHGVESGNDGKVS